jgi:ABC-2 type transport system permease protein
MSLQRIRAMLRQELYITTRAVEVIVDLFFFSAINIIIFGFVSIYLAGSNQLAASYILMGMILWEVIRVTQYSISFETLWNIWSRNLSNIFVSPISLKEYITAGIIAGAIKAIIIFIMISAVANFFFNFNVFLIGGLNLLLYFINLTIFSWSIGIGVLALIFRFGTRIQAFAWGIIFVFQPLTAAFFPVSVLPDFMQRIAYALPPTYIFEAARGNILNPETNWNYISIAFAENIFYLALAVWFFNLMFNKSKETGQFARNEG